MTEQNLTASSSKPKRAKNKRAPTQPLADNLFKEVTEEESRSVGMRNIAGELQIRKSTRSDLVLQVPDGVSLDDTIFDFFSRLNVVEFKSEDDNPLDDREFYKNVMRLYAIYEQDKKLQMRDLLNVIVTAEIPNKFLSFIEESGYNFREVPNRKWLRRSKFGNQEVAIVICELLPVEPKYYPWLLFAPSKSETWRKFIEELVMSGSYPDLLDEALALRMERVEVIYREVVEMANSKRRLTKWEKERIQAFKNVLERERAEGEVALLNVILSTFPVEERVAGLNPEERLTGLKPEEREALLKLLQEQQPAKDAPDNSRN